MSAPFKKGDRVQLRANGRRVANARLDEWRSLRGTVATNSRDPFMVTVLRDTQATPQRWCVLFWEHIPAPRKAGE